MPKSATASTGSLQSTQPLTRVAANSGQEPVRQIAFHPHLLLDPPYQRGSVWGPTRRRNLIRSLLLGIPTGNIFWNHRHDTLAMAVVDGRQRIETVQLFIGGHLDVPASWFDDDKIVETHPTDDGEYVFYTNLSPIGQALFDRCSMTTQLTQLATLDEEAELFELINYGGLPQGETD